MKKFLALILALSLTLPAVATDKRQHSSAKRVAKVATFPLVHPLSFLKGGLYGVLTVVGAVADGVESVTAVVASGAAKADAAVDAAQATVEPSPTPTPTPQQ